jgi:hypothetical protein
MGVLARTAHFNRIEHAAPLDLPLIRKPDQKEVGTLTIGRANHPAVTVEDGARRANPVRVDQLLITLTDAQVIS